jgi:hypothetical protein
VVRMNAREKFDKEQRGRLGRRPVHNTKTFDTNKRKQTQEPRYNSGTWGTRFRRWVECAYGACLG